MSRDQAGMGGTPGGARSGTTEGPMTSALRRSLLRGIVMGDFASAGNALDQKMRGDFHTSEDRLRGMSAESARVVMASSPSVTNSFADKLHLKFAQAGMAKDLLVMTIGAQREHTDRVEAEIKALLTSKPLSLRTPDELNYIADKFGELGVTVGKEPGALNAAISGFIAATPGMDKMMKGGTSAPELALKR